MTRWHVVTGGGGGMGLACARRLAKTGPVLLAELDAGRLNAALATLEAEGCEVAGVVCDVSKTSDVQALADAVRSRGGLAAAIHTAGLSPMMASGARIFEVNLIGTLHVTDALQPLAESGTACVCLSSMAGHTAQLMTSPELEAILDSPLEGDLVARIARVRPELDPASSGSAYGLSKWGVQRLVRRRAADWARQGARIVSLSPGIIDTPMGQFENERQPVMKQIAENTPLGRMGRADEIAAVAVFLCSQDASYVTGVDWLVDGGATAGFRAAVEDGLANDEARGL